MEQEGNTRWFQIHRTQVRIQVFQIRRQSCHLVEFTKLQVPNNTISNKPMFHMATVFHLKTLAWSINFNLKNRCPLLLLGILVILEQHLVIILNLKIILKKRSCKKELTSWQLSKTKTNVVSNKDWTYLWKNTKETSKKA